MSLESDIRQWDQKSTDAITAIYARHSSDTTFTDTIVRLIEQEALQRGATWLLKHHFEQGEESPDRSVVGSIYDTLGRFSHWEARLHILQCIQHLPIPNNRLQAVEEFLRECLAGDAKFVRAWAYSGFYELAAQHPQFRQEAEELFKNGLKHETAGSVRSRIRRVIKQGFDNRQ